MQLHFKPTDETEPTKWFRLYLDQFPTEIYYPNQELINFWLSDRSCRYGLDIEAEASLEVKTKLVELLPFFDDNGRTRFEIILAITAISKQLDDRFFVYLMKNNITLPEFKD